MHQKALIRAFDLQLIDNVFASKFYEQGFSALHNYKINVVVHRLTHYEGHHYKYKVASTVQTLSVCLWYLVQNITKFGIVYIIIYVYFDHISYRKKSIIFTKIIGCLPTMQIKTELWFGYINVHWFFNRHKKKPSSLHE